jgi:L-ascorbate metabolism protein UlaG (beta-lactamase superfamily)
MIITYHGLECFKISQGDITLATNPISKESKAKTTNFGADITLITTNIPDTNGRDQTSRGDRDSFIIDGPGEYEMKDIFIKGFLSEGPGGKTNTIYLISFEGMNICFLGALANPALSTETLEAIEDVDILFVPIGGGNTLESALAYKLAVSLEPSVIIPMHYSDNELKKFIKEGGKDKIESLDKLVVKKKDLEGQAGEITVLKVE